MHVNNLKLYRMCLYLYIHNKYTQNIHISWKKNFILDAINHLTSLIKTKSEMNEMGLNQIQIRIISIWIKSDQIISWIRKPGPIYIYILDDRVNNNIRLIVVPVEMYR